MIYSVKKYDCSKRFEAHALALHTSIGKSDASSKLIYMY
jgi:hypothetical protein